MRAIRGAHASPMLTFGFVWRGGGSGSGAAAPGSSSLHQEGTTLSGLSIALCDRQCCDGCICKALS